MFTVPIFSSFCFFCRLSTFFEWFSRSIFQISFVSKVRNATEAEIYQCFSLFPLLGNRIIAGINGTAITQADCGFTMKVDL